MQIDQVRKVRRFNRTVTQRVGALDQSYLDRGRPLGEARIIYEIGRAGVDLRVLREKLALDSGYISRLLRSLERQGLVEGGQGRHRRRQRQRAAILAPGSRAPAALHERDRGHARARPRR